MELYDDIRDDVNFDDSAVDSLPPLPFSTRGIHPWPLQTSQGVYIPPAIHVIDGIIPVPWYRPPLPPHTSQPMSTYTPDTESHWCPLGARPRGRFAGGGTFEGDAALSSAAVVIAVVAAVANPPSISTAVAPSPPIAIAVDGTDVPASVLSPVTIAVTVAATVAVVVSAAGTVAVAPAVAVAAALSSSSPTSLPLPAKAVLVMLVVLVVLVVLVGPGAVGAEAGRHSPQRS